jgi:hypothetical protein
MPSAYLQPADYAAFGAASATADQITQASTLIDAYLLRPQGLVYAVDGNGQPAYMAALAPDLTLKSVSAFGPGNGVQVQVTGPLSALQVGDCVVLDRQNSEITETVQVTGINGQVATLGSLASNLPTGVAFTHGADCTMETGMLISEARYVPRQRSEIVLGNTPVARIVGGTGRYAYGRRGDAGYSNMDDFNLLSAVTQFGGPPVWELWPANTPAGIDAPTGKVWVPAGVMLAYYSEVNVSYLAGYSYARLPDVVKMACGRIVTALAQDPGIGNFRSVAAGDTKLERFASSNIDADTKAMLQPFRARAFA